MAGHPITNDPLYSSRVWRPDRAPGHVVEALDTDLQAREAVLDKQHTTTTATTTAAHATALVSAEAVANEAEDTALSVVSGCSDCARTYPDPQPQDMVLYLHAHK